MKLISIVKIIMIADKTTWLYIISTDKYLALYRSKAFQNNRDFFYFEYQVFHFKWPWVEVILLLPWYQQINMNWNYRISTFIF
jgi:hypothetical protein